MYYSVLCILYVSSEIFGKNILKSNLDNLDMAYSIITENICMYIYYKYLNTYY